MKTKLFLGLAFISWAFILIAEPVTKSEAKLVAVNFYSTTAKGLDIEFIQVDIAQTIHTKFYNEKSGQMENLAVYYVFNINNSDGFVMVSADDAVVPVLGYSLHGHFDPDIKAVNYLKWVEGYKEQIRYIIENDISATPEISQKWDELRKGNNVINGRNSSTVNPLLGQITWDQVNGFNAQCPYDNSAGSNVVVGCVATAMAQIMKYWSHPNNGSGFHSYNHSSYGTLAVNYGSASYDWSQMPDAVASAESAKLSYHCGVAVDMNYSATSSGAYPNDAYNAFKNYFGYKSSTIALLERWLYTDSNWKLMLKADLDNNKPIFYCGFGTGGGHAFICDGYDASDYFHFNWGWYGAYDGYFQVDALDPSGLGTGGGSGGFNSNQLVITGIEPDNSGSASAELELNSYFSLNPTSTISYGDSFSISVDIINNSIQNFTGSIGAALLDNNNNLVNFIETKTNQSLTSGSSSSLSFSSHNMSVVPAPGAYSIVLYQKETSAANWTVIKDGSYYNSESLDIEIINSKGIELDDSISPSVEPIVLGTAFTVNTNYYNNSFSDFSGKLSIDLHDMFGNLVYSIEEKSLTITAGFPSGNIIFSDSGIDSLSAGTYQMAAWMQPDSGDWELVGNGSYYNPIRINISAPDLIADIYENNDDANNAYSLTANYIGATANISTPGSNIHEGSDFDFYQLDLPTGYSYYVSAQVLDSYNTSGGIYDNDVLFSYDTGSGFSDAFDNASHTIIQPNGGTVIFKVASYFVGETGSYELQITSNKGTVNVSKISEDENLNIYPVPAKDLINLEFKKIPEGLKKIEIYNAIGQSIYQVTKPDFNTGLIQISTMNWPGGTYWIMLSSSDAITRKTFLVAN